MSLLHRSVMRQHQYKHTYFLCLLDYLTLLGANTGTKLSENGSRPLARSDGRQPSLLELRAAAESGAAARPFVQAILSPITV